MDRIQAKGLYDFKNEHDNCGIGFVAHIKGEKSHEIITRGIEVLENMNHRGAEGADGVTGDGAGILIQIPHEFYVSLGVNLPENGNYATGLVFLPQDEDLAKKYLDHFIDICNQEDLEHIATRNVPVNTSVLGPIAKSSEPRIKQIFVKSSRPEQGLFERKIFIARRRAEIEMIKAGIPATQFYMPSFSNKTIVFKGMLMPEQISAYYLDLKNKVFKSAFCLVHSRFSTNTFPSWDLAQPFRMVAHNGEINTVKGNRFWMAARESLLKSELLGNDINKVFPIIQPNASDSASFDNTLEFLVQSGKSLPHALAMMVPESWNDKNPIPSDLKAFYEYHSMIMEPWDGPASLIFTDGKWIGGTLDRNGLRPSRYVITKDDLLVMGSEVGVQTFAPEDIIGKGRLKPGKLLLVDTENGRIIYDDEIKKELMSKHPYRQWIEDNRITLDQIKSGRSVPHSIGKDYSKYLLSFGYSREDVYMLIQQMAQNGEEPVLSMGNDSPIALLSKKPQRVFAYFKQLFAQVTNPAIDPIREELVMSLTGYIGSLNKNLLAEIPDHAKMIKFTSPIIDNNALETIKNLNYKGFKSAVLPMLYNVSEGGVGLGKALDQLCVEAEKAVDSGHNYIILSDRGISAAKAAIPSLLAVSAVHHYLIDKRKRLQVDFVIETAEAREVMHFALLFGYGASIINPYLSFAVIDNLVKQKKIQLDVEKAEYNYIKSINKGVLKILSKMGTSTLRSYRGAQIFECIGIDKSVVDKYLTGTDTRIGGVTLEHIASDISISHADAFIALKSIEDETMLPNNGAYAFRKGGEAHAWSPESIALLQWSTKTNNYQKYKEFSQYQLDRAKEQPIFIRDYFTFKKTDKSIDINEVEPVSEITRRFVTGAMSYGSISREAHEALAIAMNTLGGKSNTGEGGEDPERFKIGADGLNRRSAIKQVASGRFGVTTNYLVNADEIQIKISQGAKPGEGGQLPGHKVNKIIAKTRYSTPGITLISPPPHHDIYSIEDLKQLIFDLKNVNPTAEISVKLVSEVGVGTVAAGVAKAISDRILISGGEGGTGASPVSSIKHAGLPVELGLAETQQTLVMNNLREKVKLQADGQLKTGWDIVKMGMLGAEEFGLSTGPLVSLGCIMMRKCHLNTCPVGVATQDEELRARFRGNYQYVVNYITFIAQEIREIMATLGFKTFNELIGRTDLIEIRNDVPLGKAGSLLFDKLLFRPEEANKNNIYFAKPQDHKLTEVIDQHLITLSKAAIYQKQKVQINKPITNIDRAVGAMLSGKITKELGVDAFENDTINCTFEGSAGQSFGAFLVKGVTFRLVGDSNDYIGKGLSGGKIIVHPHAKSPLVSHENIIVGNTVLYGATSGEFYASGIAGERFAVRNSGATAVIEGVGDHGCEYMTGGRVVVLGKTGRNFAAGMSGGIAYVLDRSGKFDYFCNMGMVELSLVQDFEDVTELKDMIVKHYNYTGSILAGEILNNWDEYLPKFIKVIPYEYKKVLNEIKLEEINKKIAVMQHQ